ncbi:glycosyl hydrolase [Paraphoma chrysanthemicola]|nr:glycosyl hydrolase [Paraphoma chrysanthemicola]
MRGWSSSWDWGQGVGLYGIWKHYEATGDKESFNAVQDWFSVRLPKGQRKHVNSMSVFSTLANLYNTTRDPRWVPYLEEWGSWCMYNLTRTTDGGMQHVTSAGPNTQQLWIDTLMMAAIPLAKIGHVLNKPKYVEEAKRQFDIHIKYLYDTKADLFFHGWTFAKNNNFAAAHWARGNAWAAITLTEILELLYADKPAQDPKLRKTLEELQLALQPLQDKQHGGLWRTVLDFPVANGSYVETSSSSGFLYSYLKAERKSWVPKGQYTTAVAPGIKGVLQNIATNGEVRNVSAGTGMGDAIDFYFNIAKIQTMWGQAMAVMALTEVWLS